MAKSISTDIILTTEDDEEINCELLGIKDYLGQSYAALLDKDHDLILLYRYHENKDSFSLEAMTDSEMQHVKELFQPYTSFLDKYQDMSKSSSDKNAFFIPGKAKQTCEELLRNFGLEFYIKHLKPQFKRTIQLIGHNKKSQQIQGLTKIGGYPDVPPSFSWPIRDNQPLTFLLQINCEQIAPYDHQNILPKEGLLYFFYDTDYLPTYSEGESHEVIYIKDSTSLQPIKKETPYDEVYQYFVNRCSLPDVDSISVFSKEQKEDYDLLLEWMDEHTQVFGHTRWIQDDPINMIQRNFQDDFFQKDDWILLLQLDSVYNANMNWVDDGMLYFFIHKDDLAHRRFHKVKLVLQYY